MNHEPREKLRQLVNEQGESFYLSAKRCKALLQDYFSQYPTETFLLVTAIEKGIVTDLLKFSQTSTPLPIRLAQLSNKLQKLGLSAEGANWAIESWAQALGINARLPETADPILNQEADRLKREVESLRQRERQLSDELAKKTTQPNPSLKNNPALIIGGIIAGIMALSGLAGLSIQSQKITRLNEEVSSLESVNENLSGKFTERSKKFNTLQNIRDNLNNFINGRSTSSTAINFCHKASQNQTISAVLSYQQNGKWRSIGWYNVEPNKCNKVDYRPDDGVEKVYIYGKYADNEAMTENKFSSEDSSFCINYPQEFDIANSDRADNCQGEGKKMVGMSEFIVLRGVNTWNFTEPESP